MWQNKKKYCIAQLKFIQCYVLMNLKQQLLLNIKIVFNTIVVNKQTESHKGFIFYLHEVELLYNDVHHSQPTL